MVPLLMAALVAAPVPESCNDAPARFAAGQSLYVQAWQNHGDFAAALPALSMACNCQGAVACLYLGAAYHWCSTCGADSLAQAAHFYERACEGGNAVGCLNLGIVYEAHPKLMPNPEALARSYQRACAGDELQGCALEGVLLWDQGKDAAKAAGLLRKACGAADVTACRTLDDAFKRGTPMIQAAGLSETDAAVARKQACQAGDSSRCTHKDMATAEDE